MITLEEFANMREGDIFYVAAPGRHKLLESNTLCKEVFCNLRGEHIVTVAGGISFEYGKRGASFFRNLEEALSYMKERHERLHKEKLKGLASKIELLKREVGQLENKGCGIPDFMYHDRSKKVDIYKDIGEESK